MLIEILLTQAVIPMHLLTAKQEATTLTYAAACTARSLADAGVFSLMSNSVYATSTPWLVYNLKAFSRTSWLGTGVSFVGVASDVRWPCRPIPLILTP